MPRRDSHLVLFPGNLKGHPMSPSSQSFILNQWEVDCAKIALAEDVVLLEQAQGRTFKGQPAVRELFQALFVEGFSEVKIEVHTRVLNQEAAIWEFTFSGRHRGRFMGLPPTGRDVCLPMAVVCQIKAGQITRIAFYYDAGTLLRELGLAL